MAEQKRRRKNLPTSPDNCSIWAFPQPCLPHTVIITVVTLCCCPCCKYLRICVNRRIKRKMKKKLPMVVGVVVVVWKAKDLLVVVGWLSLCRKREKATNNSQWVVGGGRAGIVMWKGKESHQQVIMTRWWWLRWALSCRRSRKPPTSCEDLLVVVRGCCRCAESSQYSHNHRSTMEAWRVEMVHYRPSSGLRWWSGFFPSSTGELMVGWPVTTQSPNNRAGCKSGVYPIYPINRVFNLQ